MCVYVCVYIYIYIYIYIYGSEVKSKRLNGYNVPWWIHGVGIRHSPSVIKES
jgi:hypothetical protein